MLERFMTWPSASIEDQCMATFEKLLVGEFATSFALMQADARSAAITRYSSFAKAD
jgi:hypothetical protein